MKSAEERRRRIPGLPGVIERRNAGIHEHAFFVGGTMFMRVHPEGFRGCDIRLARVDQARGLAEGKAHPKRWAPEKGCVTFVAGDENGVPQAMELIEMSHDYFAGERD
jgi:Luciferase